MAPTAVPDSLEHVQNRLQTELLHNKYLLTNQQSRAVERQCGVTGEEIKALEWITRARRRPG